MKRKITTSTLVIRSFDAIVPILSWILITLPVWLSPFHPAVVAYFIIAFDLYFLYKALSTTYFATISYKSILVHLKIPYFKKLTLLNRAAEIKHFIIIPNFKEPLYKLEASISSLTQSDYPYQNIYLVLAFEKRETEAKNKAISLEKKYKQNFVDVLTTFHLLLPDEVPGKASNQKIGRA